MKSNNIKSFAAACFVVLIFIVAGHAQGRTPLLANIPFDFYAGDHKFQAGEYLIRNVNQQTDGATLSLQSKDGKASGIFIMISKWVSDSGSDANPSIKFNRYGSEYFLSEVSNPAALFGASAIRSKMEKAYDHQMVAAMPVSVALGTVKKK